MFMALYPFRVHGVMCRYEEYIVDIKCNRRRHPGSFRFTATSVSFSGNEDVEMS